eukprot:TRINITY_DN4087_c0_g2_i1.p1 TRINITY_DN4087_c0_g2~~TRINITY_DN4087_c0_g2_i1.p1  ORF type:complete len:171 (-),score=26.68 TRINITY_DN4087_c0_g2_i1:147-596(-)
MEHQESAQEEARLAAEGSTKHAAKSAVGENCAQGRRLDAAVLVVRNLAGEVIFEVPESKMSWLSSLPLKDHICRQQKRSSDACTLFDGECKIESGTSLKDIMRHHCGGLKELTLIAEAQSPLINGPNPSSSRGCGIRVTSCVIDGRRVV